MVAKGRMSLLAYSKPIKLKDDVSLLLGNGSDEWDSVGDCTLTFDGDALVLNLGAIGLFHIGAAANTVGSQIHVFDGGANKPGALVLYEADGTASYFWSSAGVLRHHTAYPTTAASDGTIVGEDGS